MAACRNGKQSFCSEILDTRVSVVDELSSRQQTLSPSKNEHAGRKPFCCGRVCRGYLSCFRIPAHYQEENNSAVMFRLTIVLRGKVKPCQLISMRRLQWRSRGVKAVSGSSPWLLFFNSLSSGSTLRWKLCANAHSWKMSLEHRVPLSHQDGG